MFGIAISCRSFLLFVLMTLHVIQPHAYISSIEIRNNIIDGGKTKSILSSATVWDQFSHSIGVKKRQYSRENYNFDKNSKDIMKKAELYFEAKGIPFETLRSQPKHWRTHAKLAVRPLSKWGGIKIGLFKPGTHDVIDGSMSDDHHPRINEAVAAVRSAALECNIVGYSEPNIERNILGSGEIRYIQLTYHRMTGKIQLVLVWNDASLRYCGGKVSRLIKYLTTHHSSMWHSIFINFQTSSKNTIFNNDVNAWKLLHGEEFMTERIGNVDFVLRPQIFRQANVDAFEKHILPYVIKNTPPNRIVAEIYSGIGVLGLNVANKSSLVCCADNNPFIDDVFDDCVDSLSKEDQQKVFFNAFDANMAVESGFLEETEVLIVDPPRKGLDSLLIDILVDRLEMRTADALKRIIYVSCGFDSFVNDVKQLEDSGKWKLTKAQGVDLFPGTQHLETIGVLDRVGKSKYSGSDSTVVSADKKSRSFKANKVYKKC